MSAFLEARASGGGVKGRLITVIDASLRGGDLSGTPRLGGEAAGPAVEEAVGTVGGEEAPMTDLIAHA